MREEVIIRRYIQNLLTESKIHFSKDGGPNVFMIYWQADHPGSAIHLVATLRLVWCGVFDNVDKFKLSFKERNGIENSLECDDLRDPEAYKWLIELIKTIFHSYAIKYEHRHKA